VAKKPSCRGFTVLPEICSLGFAQRWKSEVLLLYAISTRFSRCFIVMPHKDCTFWPVNLVIGWMLAEIFSAKKRFHMHEIDLARH
jgi:hypothetical protein